MEKCSMELNSHNDLEEKLAKPSRSLLYTAFKAAFVARMVFESGRYKKNQLASRTVVSRSPFGNEINDIIDLVRLWINSGLDADFYQY
jgi:hypothetical protein